MFKRLWSIRKPSNEDSSRQASQQSTAAEDPALTLRTRGTNKSLVIPQSTASRLLRTSGATPSPPSLGLHILHAPGPCVVDIILVHGLRGHSHKTWTKNHDPSLFWPESWLPFEPGMGAARIMTFGYNAGWRGQTKNMSNMGDFAKDLLYEMRFAKDGYGNDLGIGTKPIIFVVHSMGGLVVKKAYMMGMYDENYKDMVASVSAMIFLSTPHRGSNLAETLNRVVAATMKAPKSFISDLHKNSTALEELNEQFRHLAPGLSIWSFYETLSTTIGPRKLMVLEKDSLILGYPNEISKPLHADHKTVCKYDSPGDINYISVRNAITTLVSLCGERSEESQARSEPTATTTVEDTVNLEDLFRNCATSEDDYSTLRKQWIPNTCGWFLKEQQVRSWLYDAGDSSVLWYSAPPASGKSVLSAFVVSHLRESKKNCQYFFPKHSEQRKTSTAAALKAIAMQMARDIPKFGKDLSTLPEDGLGLNSNDSTMIWKNVIERVLGIYWTSEPLYWIIDAVDECDNPKDFLDCLKGLAGSSTPVHVLLLSRNLESISVAFDRLSRSIPVSRLQTSGNSENREDIEVFIDQELDHMRGSEDFLKDLRRSILSRSSGNFLWIKLVLDEILGCHTEESIQEVLDNIPDDIFDLYQRMENSILKTTRKSNLPLIQALLEWATCAHRSLTLKEMSQALLPEFSKILDLSRTIHDTCGHFVQVSERGIVSILHHTAHEYFMRTPQSHFFIEEKSSHLSLFKKTMFALSRPELRTVLTQSQHTLQSSQPFLFYSAVTWSYHLGKSQHGDPDVLNTLVEFFKSTSVMCWIHILALIKRVDVLVNAAKVVTAVVTSARGRDKAIDPMFLIIQDLDILEHWAADLTKLVGKFGRILVSAPDIIYEVIPALSPRSASISQHGYNPGTSSIQVVGLEDTHWNDNLASLPLPIDTQAWIVCSAGKTLAVLGSTGIVCLWNSLSFMEMGSIDHGGPVTAMALNFRGTQLVTYGLKETKVFAVAARALLHSIPNPLHTKALDIVFTEDDTKIIMGGDDRMIRFTFCDRSDQEWQTVHPNLLKETLMDGTVTNSPYWLQFNGDNTMVGAAYRGAPLSIWRLADGRCINKCKRANVAKSGDQRPSANWFAVGQFTWNPVTGHVLGLYRGGCVFKWHPLTGENVEVREATNGIAASPNGKLFATSSSDRSVRIWDFENFSVIYKLSSGDLVMGLAFSPNSCRFYDLRGRFYDLRGGTVNAWEPDSMTRFNESEAHLSDSNIETRSLTAVSTYCQERPDLLASTAAIAVSPNGHSYCVAYRDGNVLLFQDVDREGDQLFGLQDFFEDPYLALSRDRCYAAAGIAGDIQAMPLGLDNYIDRAMETIRPRLDLGGSNVDQIFFNQEDGGLLFVGTKKNCFVWSYLERGLQASIELEPSHDRTWLPHHSDPKLLLSVSSVGATVYFWADLKIKETISFNLKRALPALPPMHSEAQEDEQSLNQDAPNSTSTKNIVQRAFKCQDDAHMLLALTSHGNNGQSQETVWISELSSWYSTTSQEVEMWPLPMSISPDIYFVLGVLPGSKLVFLDRDLWVCVLLLGEPTTSEELYQRYYFIPRDWVASHSLKSCVLKPDGTLFWPRNDKVVRISCDFNFARRISMLY